MFTSTFTRSFGKVMVMLFSLALLCVLSVGSPVASAQTIQKAAPATHMSAPQGVHPHSFTPCTRVHGSSFDVFCFSPTVTTNPNCKGTQYFKATDNNGQPVDFTYTDQGNTCVYVSFSFTFTRNSCTVNFYVPNGWGNAIFNYTLNVGATYYVDPINEDIYSGFVKVFSPYGVGTMSFTDHQSPGSRTLGWGSSSSDGIQEICTN